MLVKVKKNLPGSSRSQLIGLLAIVLLGGALGLTVLSTGHQQSLSQHAASSPNPQASGYVYFDTNQDDLYDTGDSLYTGTNPLSIDWNGSQGTLDYSNGSYTITWTTNPTASQSATLSITPPAGYVLNWPSSENQYQFVYVGDNNVPNGWDGCSMDTGTALGYWAWFPSANVPVNCFGDNTLKYLNFGLVPQPPTPTPVDGPTLQLSVLLHGIGNSGDNANPTNSSFSNKSPVTPSRLATVTIVNAENIPIATADAALTYTSASGSFTGQAILSANFLGGDYLVKIKTDRYLRGTVPGIQVLPNTGMVTLPAVTLVAGDITGDNVVNILDFNTLLGCYSDFGPATDCDPQKKLMSDLTDDGNVDQSDYNLFLRELSAQPGT